MTKIKAKPPAQVRNPRGAGRKPHPEKRMLKMAIALTPDQDAYVTAQAEKHGVKRAVAVRVMVEQVKRGLLGDEGEALFTDED